MQSLRLRKKNIQQLSVGRVYIRSQVKLSEWCAWNGLRFNYDLLPHFFLFFFFFDSFSSSLHQRWAAAAQHFPHYKIRFVGIKEFAKNAQDQLPLQVDSTCDSFPPTEPSLSRLARACSKTNNFLIYLQFVILPFAGFIIIAKTLLRRSDLGSKTSNSVLLSFSTLPTLSLSLYLQFPHFQWLGAV